MMGWIKSNKRTRNLQCHLKLCNCLLVGNCGKMFSVSALRMNEVTALRQEAALIGFTPSSGSLLVLGTLCGGWVCCHCSLAEAGTRVGNVFTGPTGKWSGSVTQVWEQVGGVSAPPGTPQTQQLLTGFPRPVQAATVVRCCFCFDSSPGLGHRPPVTHSLVAFGPFYSPTFFFQGFSLCFSRFSGWMKQCCYCLRISWICLRSGVTCLTVSTGTLRSWQFITLTQVKSPKFT